LRLVAEAALKRALGILIAQIDVDRLRISSLHERIQAHDGRLLLLAGKRPAGRNPAIASAFGEDIARTARIHLERHGVDDATVVVRDGSAGLPEHAPSDVILVAAAFPQVTARWSNSSQTAAGSSSRLVSAALTRSSSSAKRGGVLSGDACEHGFAP